MSEAYIIDAVRTPRGVGKPGKGALSHLHPQHLGATVLRALKERNNIDTKQVDDVIFSTSTQKGKQGGDLGRMSALAAGYDITASGVTLDRFCGGGITAVNLAAAQVMSGMEDLVIAGGVEMMSYTATIGAEEAAAGLKPLRCEGTYFLNADVGGDAVGFCRELPARCGVVAIPMGVFYDDVEAGATLVRFAFCKRPEVIAEAARRLADPQ